MPPPAIPASPSPGYGLSAPAVPPAGAAAAPVTGNALASWRISGGAVQACGTESALTWDARVA